MGRVDWNDYQSAIECEFMGWEEVKMLESTLKDTEKEENFAGS